MAADEKSPDEHVKMKRILRIRELREQRLEHAYTVASELYAMQEAFIERKRAQLESYIEERNRQLRAMRKQFSQRAGGMDYERMLIFEEQTKMTLIQLSGEMDDATAKLHKMAEDVRRTYQEWLPARSKRMKTEEIVKVKGNEAREYLDLNEEDTANESWRPHGR